MLTVIEKVNDVVNNFIWGVPAVDCALLASACMISRASG